MSQTIAQPRLRGLRRAGRFRGWRMAGAMAVASLIVTIGAFGLTRSTPPRPAARFAVLPEAAPVVPTPAETVPPAEPSDEALLDVARRAVEAWGRFASTGQLAEVAEEFVLDGPQYQQFQLEAPSRRRAALGPPYRFALVAGTVLAERPEGDRIVRADLELTREGAPPQRFHWDLRLRRGADGRWRVWTVLEAPPSGVTPEAGAGG